MQKLYLSAVLLVVTFATLASCSTEKEVAKVAVPNTNMVLVLNEDEKQMFRYQVFADEKLESDNNFLGPHDHDVLSRPTVNANGSTVRFTWRGPYITQFVEFDVVACEITQDSHGAGRRKMPGCRRTSTPTT
jgi:hypothetical protein